MMQVDMSQKSHNAETLNDASTRRYHTSSDTLEYESPGNSSDNSLKELKTLRPHLYSMIY